MRNASAGTSPKVGVGVLGRFAEIVDRQERGKSIASLLDRFATPFEPIDDPKDSLDVQTEILCRFGSLERTASAGDNVFDNHAAHARLNGSFDQLACAMRFGFFANHEAEQGQASLSCMHDDRRGDWIGSDRKAADRRGQLAWKARLDQVQQSGGDAVGSLWVQGHFAAIEVEGGLFAAGEGKVPELQGVLAHQRLELLLVVWHRSCWVGGLFLIYLRMDT
jgi:hypothetical protein